MLSVTRFVYSPGEPEEADIELVDVTGAEFIAEFDHRRGVWQVSNESGAIALIGGDVAPGRDLITLLWNIELEVTRIVRNRLSCGYVGHPPFRERGLWVDPDSLAGYDSVATGVSQAARGWYAREQEYEIILTPDESVIARVDGKPDSQVPDGGLRWMLDENTTLLLIRGSEPTPNADGHIPFWIERLCMAIVAKETIGNVCWRRFVELDR
ncbi:hypothetical protein PQR33_30540 [Paraburkholderia sediminicola]|uniref:hypothetical protein n=1 Tax=Paraburkholderia sediminicola TaxID=458836 RepID=UPI0038BDE872